ncbi:FkbM family methyltransferase [Hoeflea poritis]|uniref:FkbM family methyltransferase n=1 Tax=Hoeflea poritis TaxID=2993659 RepID=A0ABT4VLA2_9HYPH|nr:FkbM family methyltransferase [Hoeflea poritis]MDA4845459.1 FkbM family methyltransferase [Hoeflea poritis]
MGSTRVVRWYVKRKGFLVERWVGHQVLNQLLKSLRPVTTQHRLIRLGGDTDGGYLVPDDLEGILACFSPGVGDVSEFETDLAKRDIRSFLADHSVEGPASPNPHFSFEKKFVGTTNDEATIRLGDWVETSGCAPDDDLILQMDIEGTEYDVILDVPEDVLSRFRIMVVEFHDLPLFLGRTGFRFAKAVFDKLLRNHTVVHLHPNNNTPVIEFHGLEIPSVMEFTFLRNDRIEQKSPAHTFPHHLDRPNVASRDEIVLPDCWFRAR